MSGLEQEFEGRVEAENVDAKTPAAEEEIDELGFDSHGLVVRSPEGEVLWKQPDHEVDMAEARDAIERLLAER